jgi:hypothetical protein
MFFMTEKREEIQMLKYCLIQIRKKTKYCTLMTAPML